MVSSRDQSPSTTARTEKEPLAHTPGPWAYRPQPYDDWGWVRDANSKLVAMARNPSAGELEDYRRNKGDPYEANARLIAAAPDLLEALRTLTSPNGYTNDDVVRAREAIAKAVKP